VERLSVADEIDLAFQDVKALILAAVNVEWRAESHRSELVE
jgi:hypothetical protein